MTNKQPTVSLFKQQNDGLVFEVLQRTDAEWAAIHNVVLKKESTYHFSGNEYVILHSHYGIVILDILPTLRTSNESAKILLETISHTSTDYCPPIQILGIEHKNIESLSDYLNDITRQDKPKIASNDKKWTDDLKKSLHGDLLKRPAMTENTYFFANANFAKNKKTESKRFIAPAVAAGAVFLITLILSSQYFFDHSASSDNPKIFLASASLEIIPIPYYKSEPVFEPVPVEQIARPDTDAAFQVAAPVIVSSIRLPTWVSQPSAPILPPSPAAPKLQEADLAASQSHVDQGRMARYSSANLNPASRSNAARCQAIIMRAQLGALQSSDLQFLRRGC